MSFTGQAGPGPCVEGANPGPSISPGQMRPGSVQHGERMSAKLEGDFGKSANFD